MTTAIPPVPFRPVAPFLLASVVVLLFAATLIVLGVTGRLSGSTSFAPSPPAEIDTNVTGTWTTITK